MKVSILLTGRLRTDGFCEEYERDHEGRIPLEISQGARVEDVIRSLGIPPCLVTGTTLNGKRCGPGSSLQAGDRVMLMPPEIAPLWRYTQPVESWTDCVLSLLVYPNGRLAD